MGNRPKKYVRKEGCLLSSNLDIMSWCFWILLVAGQATRSVVHACSSASIYVYIN